MPFKTSGRTVIVGSDNEATVRDVTGAKALDVSIVDGAGNQVTSFGGSGGTSATDDSAFTAGSGSGTPVMGFFSTDTVDANDVGVLAMDASRRLLVSIEADNVGIGGGTQYTEDAAAAADPVGNAVILVRDDALSTLVSTDGDNVAQRGTNYGASYVTIADGSGNIVGADGSGHLQVDIAADSVGIGGGTQYAVDTALGATPTGTLAVAIRDDALSALTPVEGDAIGLRVDANGALWTIPSGTVTVDASGTAVPVTDNGGNLSIDWAGTVPPIGSGTEAAALRVTLATDSTGVVSVDDNSGSLTVDNAGTFATQATLQTGSNTVGSIASITTSVTPGTAAGNLGKAEDAGHTTGDVGVMALSVRSSSATALSGTNLDYQPLITNASGRLYVTSTVDAALPTGSNTIGNIGTIATSVTPGTAAGNLGKAEDGVHTTGDVGVQSLAVRTDTPTNRSGTDGDYEPLQVSAGRLWASTLVTGDALTALQLIDDPVFADSAAFTEGTSKVNVAGAVRDDVIVDAQDTAADAVSLHTNDQGALWVTQNHIDSTDDVFFYADLDETEEDPSASAITVYGFTCINVDATPVYIQFFNTNTVTVGTTTPEFSIGVPSQGDANGAGMVFTFPRPVYFDTALSVAATTTATGASGPGANEVAITIFARS